MTKHPKLKTILRRYEPENLDLFADCFAKAAKAVSSKSRKLALEQRILSPDEPWTGNTRLEVLGAFGKVNLEHATNVNSFADLFSAMTAKDRDLFVSLWKQKTVRLSLLRTL